MDRMGNAASPSMLFCPGDAVVNGIHGGFGAVGRMGDTALPSMLFCLDDAVVYCKYSDFGAVGKPGCCKNL